MNPENTTPNQAPTPESYQPTLSTEPPVPFWRRQRNIIIAAVGVVLIVLVGSFLLLNTDEPKNSTGSNQTLFTDWLKPTSELKVGQYRYVSPCQALPESTVASAFGELPKESVIKEKYIDQSLPSDRAKAGKLESECQYDYVGGSKQNIRAKFVQLESSDKVTNTWLRSELPTREEAVEQLRVGYASIKGIKDDADAKKFMDTVNSSVPKYKAVRDSASRAPEGSLKGIIVPNGNEENAFSFVGVHKNIVITLTHNPGNLVRKEGGFKDADGVKELAAMQKTFAAIKRNIDNARLSQSPAPTVRGSSNLVGKTPAVEPCKVLDAASFQKTLGLGQNQAVERTGLPLDLKTIAYRKDKSVILAENSCKRSYSAGSLPVGYALSAAEQKYGVAGFANVTLSLEHAKDKAAADKAWAELSGGSRAVGTKAEKAVISESSSFSYKGAYFRQGNYIGTVNISEVNSVGPFQPFNDLTTPDETFISAINSIIANMQQVKSQKQ